MKSSSSKAALSMGVVCLTLWSVGCAGPSNREVVGRPQPVAAAPKTLTPDEVKAESERAVSELAASAPDRAAGSAEAKPEDEGSKEASSTARVADDTTTAGRPADQAVSWPQGVDTSLDDVANYAIGSVQGREIPLADLVAKWIWREPLRVRAILDDIVLSHIIVFEAAALQIDLPDGAINQAVEGRLAMLEREAKAAGKPSLEAYVQETLGMAPATFMKYAREEAAVDLLAPRCVRAWLLRNEHREISAITVKTEEEVDQVQARLARGEAFADVARDLSIDPSKEDGGRLPPVVRGSDLVLTRTAFAAEVGSVTGPIKDRAGMLFVMVDGAPKPIEGLWPEIGEQVEASLEERGIEDPEFWQWKAHMLGRYSVNMDPFLNLVK